MKRIRTFIGVIMAMVVGIGIGYGGHIVKEKMIIGDKTESRYYTHISIGIDNDKKFVYDADTEFTMKDIADTSPYATPIHNGVRMFAIRKNRGEYYTICSLKDDKLCYVILSFNPYVSEEEFLYVKEYIEYPFVTQESRYCLDFLLEQDRPENIFKE